MRLIVSTSNEANASDMSVIGDLDLSPIEGCPSPLVSLSISQSVGRSIGVRTNCDFMAVPSLNRWLMLLLAGKMKGRKGRDLRGSSSSLIHYS